jgi:RNA-directed DNA polymerase
MLNSTPFVSIKKAFSEAYTWLKASRKLYPSSSDIWDFRRMWDIKSANIIKSFLIGSYKFDVQKKIHLSSGETIALWSSPDALVLKVLTFMIQEILRPYLSRNCYHLKGHGGLKRAVGEVMKKYPQYGFFIKTDVRSYYDSIDHHALMMRLSEYVSDRNKIRYVWQFLRRTVEWGGLYQ